MIEVLALGLLRRGRQSFTIRVGMCIGERKFRRGSQTHDEYGRTCPPVGHVLEIDHSNLSSPLPALRCYQSSLLAILLAEVNTSVLSRPSRAFRFL